jgi:hypothetical protein
MDEITTTGNRGRRASPAARRSTIDANSHETTREADRTRHSAALGARSVRQEQR